MNHDRCAHEATVISTHMHAYTCQSAHMLCWPGEIPLHHWFKCIHSLQYCWLFQVNYQHHLPEKRDLIVLQLPLCSTMGITSTH